MPARRRRTPALAASRMPTRCSIRAPCPTQRAGRSSFPTRRAFARYLADTLDATREALARALRRRSLLSSSSRALHEDMHGEALLMTLQTLELPAPRMQLRARAVHARRPRCATSPSTAASSSRARGMADFVFDNESPPTAGHVAPFTIASHPVTQGEFARYLEDDGRRTPAPLAKAAMAPWQARRFDRWAADRARRTHGPRLARRGAGLLRLGRAAPSHGERMGIRGDEARAKRSPGATSGNGPRRRSQPYPGLRARPLSRLLRSPGSTTTTCCGVRSFATRSRIANPRYRNFYLPHRSDMFAGFRTCAVEARSLYNSFRRASPH